VSVEWSVRVNRAFTLYDLLSHSTASLQEILGRPGDATLAVDAQSELLPDGVRVAIDPHRLTEVHDPRASRVGSGSIDFQIVARAIEGGCSFGLAEFIPRSDDPDSGLFAYVTSERTAGSYVLGIAVSIAAADCADNAIIDDANLLGDGRIVSGKELRTRLRVTHSDVPLAEAIPMVLANTGLAP
jgi:hypothetical protein